MEKSNFSFILQKIHLFSKKSPSSPPPHYGPMGVILKFYTPGNSQNTFKLHSQSLLVYRIFIEKFVLHIVYPSQKELPMELTSLQKRMAKQRMDPQMGIMNLKRMIMDLERVIMYPQMGITTC